MKAVRERPHFLFTAKPALKIEIQNPKSPLECFELFITPEMAELKSKEKPIDMHNISYKRTLI